MRRCTFENAASGELLARLAAFPRMKAVLEKLPPKLLALETGRPTRPIELEAIALDVRVEDVKRRIERSTFTGSGDKEKVPALYGDYVERIAGVLQDGLALRAASHAAELPPMPSDAAALPDWHLAVLRAEHASIADALSGRRLDSLRDCVPIAVEGTDTSGRAVRLDAARLSDWLLRLQAQPGNRCALLTAGPAAGKTWLLSQVIMHLLGGALVPILIKVEQLQTCLAEIEAADDWVDAYLERTCALPYHAMLRSLMAERRALLLVDGLDEAGAARAKIERHLAEKLAPQGHMMLCTSRPAGLGDCFGAFHRLELAPLSDAQQQDCLVQRLGAVRADALKAYLRNNVPLDAEGSRVTSNPLMLSMVASIAELRAGIAMPSTTAALYETAVSAMLVRSGSEMSEAAQQLLQAILFEAHAAEQRIVTAEHVSSAARRRGLEGAADALMTLVREDRLPLVRLLRTEPLQMQAFHLSFQEYFAMREVRDCRVQLPAFGWSVWWTNAVLMGVQTGDKFGGCFVDAAGLDEAPGAPAEAWRLRVVSALVQRGLPSAWLPTAAEAARGVETDVARRVASLSPRDELAVGRQVLADDIIWRSGQVTRVGDTIDVDFGGIISEGLARTKALVVASDGAGALLRVAAGAGRSDLVHALLKAGVSCLVADDRANTPLHIAAAAGHEGVCCALLAKGADQLTRDKISEQQSEIRKFHSNRKEQKNI